MASDFYNLGSADAYYGRDNMALSMPMLSPNLRYAYMAGYENYLECYS